MKNNKLLAAGLVAGATLGANQAFAFEQFFNVPGTRAMAMSGAFVATAGDSTALWYNPAGMAKLSDSIDFTIEKGDIAEEKTNAEFTPGGELYQEDSDIKYLAVAGGGMGIAYFKPYKFFSTATYNVSGTPTQAEVETELSELKFGQGLEVAKNIRVGYTLDMIFKEADIDPIGSGVDEDISQTDFGFSLGLQGDVPLGDLVMKGHKFSYGLMYRSGTDSEVEDDVFSDKVEGVPGRPQALNYGIAYAAPLSFIEALPMFMTFNYEMDDLVYEDVRNFTTTSQDVDAEKSAWGVELQLFPGFMQNGSLFVRFGGAEVEMDGEASLVEEFDVSSFGLGVKLGNWIFDYAQESRDITPRAGVNASKQDLDLSAFSISYGF